MEVQFAQKALIVKDQMILLIQKSADDPYQPLKWEIPGGRLKAGETLDEHICREVKEEVGLAIEPGRPLAMWSWTLAKHPGNPRVVAVIRECALTPDYPELINFAGHEADDHIRAWQWVLLAEVTNYDLIPNARQPILTALQLLST